MFIRSFVCSFIFIFGYQCFVIFFMSLRCLSHSHSFSLHFTWDSVLLYSSLSLILYRFWLVIHSVSHSLLFNVIHIFLQFFLLLFTFSSTCCFSVLRNTVAHFRRNQTNFHQSSSTQIGTTHNSWLFMFLLLCLFELSLCVFSLFFDFFLLRYSKIGYYSTFWL